MFVYKNSNLVGFNLERIPNPKVFSFFFISSYPDDFICSSIVQVLFKHYQLSNFEGAVAEKFLLLAIQFTDIYDKSKFAVSILTV